VGNWAIARHRSVLARTFNHAKMKSVCEARATGFYKAGRPPIAVPLNDVAQAFKVLQQRHVADYDNGFHRQRTDAVAQVDVTAKAFVDWRGIRSTNEAQDFLLALFLPKAPRT
jgi:hypothetical protein